MFQQAFEQAFPGLIWGLGAGLALILAASVVRPSDRLQARRSTGLLLNSVRMSLLAIRRHAVLTGIVCAVSVAISAVQYVVMFDTLITALLSTIWAIAIVYLFHRKFLRRDAALLGADFTKGHAGSVFLRWWAIGITFVLLGVAVFVIATFLQAELPPTWLRGALIAVGLVATLPTIYAARASFAVPAAAIGKNADFGRAFSLSRGIGLQLAGALILVWVLTQLAVEGLWLLSLTGAEASTGLLPILTPRVVGFLLAEAIVAALHVIISVACVSIAYRESVLMKEGHPLPDTAP